MEMTTGRRTVLQAVGMTLAAGATGVLSVRADAAPGAPRGANVQGAPALAELAKRLASAPRRRDFKSVPMILDSHDQWDHEALSLLLAYRSPNKQAWDNTDIAGPWINGMRNALNAQVWSFGHPDFLVVSATHGSAQLALYDQAAWDKYGLAKLAGGGFDRNRLIEERPAASADPANFEDPAGVFSPENNSIPALQRRGAVFLACHNAIWELATKLRKAGASPDGATVETIAADLTNHLIPGVVLNPGTVATLPELQRAGFHYAH